MSFTSSQGAPARKPKRFPFGDPRRTRSLGLAFVASIASYPVVWFVLLFMVALGGGAGAGSTQSENQKLAQMVVLFAAGVVAVGGFAAAWMWVAARLSHPPESRKSPRSLETCLWAVAVLVALALAWRFGVFAWNLDLVGD